MRSYGAEKCVCSFPCYVSGTVTGVSISTKYTIDDSLSHRTRRNTDD